MTHVKLFQTCRYFGHCSVCCAIGDHFDHLSLCPGETSGPKSDRRVDNFRSRCNFYQKEGRTNDDGRCGHLCCVSNWFPFIFYFSSRIFVLFFPRCVFPNNVFGIFLYLPVESVQENVIRPVENGRLVLRIFLSLYWLAMSNSMWNPFIYAYWNSTFRLGFKFAFRWMPCVRWNDGIDGPKLFEWRRSQSTIRSTRQLSIQPSTRTLLGNNCASSPNMSGGFNKVVQMATEPGHPMVTILPTIVDNGNVEGENRIDRIDINQEHATRPKCYTGEDIESEDKPCLENVY